jgi:hypothetical protein
VFQYDLSPLHFLHVDVENVSRIHVGSKRFILIRLLPATAFTPLGIRVPSRGNRTLAVAQVPAVQVQVYDELQRVAVSIAAAERSFNLD